MTTTPQIRIATVDETGNLESELTPEALAALLTPFLPEPVPAELDATLGNAQELLERFKVAPTYDVDMDKTSQFWIYAGKPFEMTFRSTASQDVVHSVAVSIRGPSQGSYPQISEWYTSQPKAGETGVLTVSLLYWQNKPIWRGWWARAL